MSYSFNVKGATKAVALAAVIAELDKVVANQPIHAADRAQAQAAAEAFVGILPDADESQEFHVSAAGWVSWTPGPTVMAANVSVTASLKAKE